MTEQFLSEKDIATLHKMYVGATPHQQNSKDYLTEAEFEQFLAVVERRRLDPFSRQIYWSKRWQWTNKDKNQGRWALGIEATIDGFRVLSERSGKYAGMIGPMWCGPDGVWKDVWLENKPPAAAKVGIIRTDFKEPLYATALWSSYVQDRSPMWRTMGPLLLGKCCEALARRTTFPEDLANLYSREEMMQADKDEDKGGASKARREAPAPESEKPAQQEAAAPARGEEKAPEPVSPTHEEKVAPQAAPEPQAARQDDAVQPEPSNGPTVVMDPTDAQRAEFKRLLKKAGLNKEGALSFLREQCPDTEPGALTGPQVDQVIAALKERVGE